MTEKQVKDKVRILIDDISIMKCVDKVLASKGVDIDEWADGWGLPKIILSAALKCLARQYEPLDSSHKNTVSNIILLL